MPAEHRIGPGATLTRFRGIVDPRRVCSDPGFGYQLAPTSTYERGGRIVLQGESGPVPNEPETEDEQAGGSESGWPHLSELDLDVCVEPSHLPGPPLKAEDE